jgi:NitT/TauT family transport system substrate-binding protein
MRRFAIAFLVLMYFQPIASVSADESVKEVSLIPHWIPQAQFAGYMIALEKGFYREAGLDLQLLRGGPGKEGFDELESGRVTFCVEWLSSAMKRRSSGLEVVNLAQIVQRSALILVARKGSGITRPEDLDGRQVGLWPGLFSLQPEALFRKHKISPIIVPNYTSMELFLKRGVDAIAAMWYNEYHLLINSGLNPDELQLFFFSDLGFNLPEDGLYTMEQTFTSDPVMCRSFVQASLKGWLYAFQHKEETVNIVMKHADAAQTGTNRAHQRWMLDRMQDLILPDGDTARLGKLSPQDYALVGRILLELEFMERLPKFEDFYKGPQ